MIKPKVQNQNIMNYLSTSPSQVGVKEQHKKLGENGKMTTAENIPREELEFVGRE